MKSASEIVLKKSQTDLSLDLLLIQNFETYGYYDTYIHCQINYIT